MLQDDAFLQVVHRAFCHFGVFAGGYVPLAGQQIAAHVHGDVEREIIFTPVKHRDSAPDGHCFGDRHQFIRRDNLDGVLRLVVQPGQRHGCRVGVAGYGGRHSNIAAIAAAGLRDAVLDRQRVVHSPEASVVEIALDCKFGVAAGRVCPLAAGIVGQQHIGDQVELHIDGCLVAPAVLRVKGNGVLLHLLDAAAIFGYRRAAYLFGADGGAVFCLGCDGAQRRGIVPHQPAIVPSQGFCGCVGINHRSRNGGRTGRLWGCDGKGAGLRFSDLGGAGICLNGQRAGSGFGVWDLGVKGCRDRKRYGGGAVLGFGTGGLSVGGDVSGQAAELV